MVKRIPLSPIISDDENYLHSLQKYKADHWFLIIIHQCGRLPCPTPLNVDRPNWTLLSGSVRLTPYLTWSVFFSQNNIFLSQQFSWNSVFQPVSTKVQTSEPASFILHKMLLYHDTTIPWYYIIIDINDLGVIKIFFEVERNWK